MGVGVILGVPGVVSSAVADWGEVAAGDQCRAVDVSCTCLDAGPLEKGWRHGERLLVYPRLTFQIPAAGYVLCVVLELPEEEVVWTRQVCGRARGWGGDFVHPVVPCCLRLGTSVPVDDPDQSAQAFRAVLLGEA